MCVTVVGFYAIIRFLYSINIEYTMSRFCLEFVVAIPFVIRNLQQLLCVLHIMHTNVLASTLSFNVPVACRYNIYRLSCTNTISYLSLILYLSLSPWSPSLFRARVIYMLKISVIFFNSLACYGTELIVFKTYKISNFFYLFHFNESNLYHFKLRIAIA